MEACPHCGREAELRPIVVRFKEDGEWKLWCQVEVCYQCALSALNGFGERLERIRRAAEERARGQKREINGVDCICLGPPSKQCPQHGWSQ